ncbi:MAG TPA: PEP-CTERM sorting domain-containing protein [Bryobacteraceae bacterium]|jgi:hypothetical protein|nr:PEP-CTERM sorting domain-containing protein [Bryobacteraceae bacterium]
MKTTETRNGVLAVLTALLPAAVTLKANDIGISVNGTCEAGSCPGIPIPFNSTQVLTFDFTFALPDGDVYLIDGSFTGTNNSNGSSASNVYDFQVTYEGNATGGPSAADTITVQRDAAFQTSLASADFDTSLVGAFSPGIAASSSASTCFDGTLTCLGPVTPPGSFNQISGEFPITSSDGAFLDDKTFTNDFGAGSPVGSYIVWGQTTPIQPPVPEPASLSLLSIGLGGIFVARLLRRPRSA